MTWHRPTTLRMDEWIDRLASEFKSGGRAPSVRPQHIARYRVDRLIGQGSWGVVYRGYDPEFERTVAIKVPQFELLAGQQQIELYCQEARTAAQLDHPHIVRVYDVGSTEVYPCYVVCQYVEAQDLATKLKTDPPDSRQAGELVAVVGEALHYAHQQGMVHRGVKPGNILIGHDGHAYLSHFGLALQEEYIGAGLRYAGTWSYLSPEQARGEGHRVDHRSDIYSLGAVLYELLAGRRTFDAKSLDLLERIATQEPKPLRQINDAIPIELERICLKSLANPARERYAAAQDMAADLRRFLSGASFQHVADATDVLLLGSQYPQPGVKPSPAASDSDSDSRPLRIVPKGLRAFDRHDADFFLELLPGPRDRNGLPQSVRCWKNRIEETDADHSFSVGVIYGPSGCGKSSLLKAGLLPRLAESVIPVYVEATAQDTESRLLHCLRERCPLPPDELSLPQTLACLRRNQGLPTGGKLLIVLDQFEQWLHANPQDSTVELVSALRQCDGGRVQCLLLVRDDFWMALTRFLRKLEVSLLEGHNVTAVDLFPEPHAVKVLAAFDSTSAA